MSVVQSITKPTALSDYAQEAFIHSISKIMSGYEEYTVIFDR